jgi:hypothetical protein
VVGIVISLIIGLLLVSGLLTRESLSEFFNSSCPNVETLVDVTALRTNPAYFWLTVTFGSFVVAGLREEVWRAATLAGMRSLWPDTFDGREGQLAAVALIAMVFGIAHLGMGTLAAAMAALIGLFLGIIMVVHGSIWPGRGRTRLFRCYNLCAASIPARSPATSLKQPGGSSRAGPAYGDRSGADSMLSGIARFGLSGEAIRGSRLEPG